MDKGFWFTIVCILLLVCFTGGMWVGIIAGQDGIATYVCTEAGYLGGHWDKDNSRILCNIEVGPDTVEWETE